MLWKITKKVCAQTAKDMMLPTQIDHKEEKGGTVFALYGKVWLHLLTGKKTTIFFYRVRDVPLSSLENSQQ